LPYHVKEVKKANIFFKGHLRIKASHKDVTSD